MDYRHSKSFGERCEYIVVAELLKRGFDVYKTLVDDQGIDCIIRVNERRYLDVQIKARSKDIAKKDSALFSALRVKPRDNYFFIFYSQHLNTTWVVPSEDLEKIVAINKKGKNVGLSAIWFNGMKNGEPYPKERYEKFREDAGFAFLK